MIGLIYSISGIIRFRQLTGKMDKETHRKVRTRLIVIACVVSILAILAILLALGVFA